MVGVGYAGGNRNEGRMAGGGEGRGRETSLGSTTVGYFVVKKWWYTYIYISTSTKKGRKY
jgi:hypothetical protein